MLLVFAGNITLVVGGFGLGLIESRVPLFDEGVDGLEAALRIQIQQKVERGGVVMAESVHVCYYYYTG